MSKQFRPAGLSVAAVLLGAGSGAVGIAAGFRISSHDAFGSSRGEAFAATADNPSAIYYNPAGIGQLTGHNFRAGVYGLATETTFESPAGRRFNNGEDLHAVPNLFYAYGIESVPLSVGLGIYSPYGLSSEWPENTGFRTVALEGRLTYLTINPVAAWRITPEITVAAGATLNQAKVELAQGVTPIPGNDRFEVDGDGFQVGFNVGGLWKVHEKFVFGVAYRSATTLDLEGGAELSVRSAVPPVFPAPFSAASEASARFPFPFNLVVGVSFRPTPKWNLEFDADYTDWSRLDSIAVKQALVPKATLVLDWKPSWYYEFGVTRYLEKGWWVSAGYIFNQSSVPDASYSPLVYDLDRHFVTVGAGLEKEHLRLGLTYQWGYGPTRTVRGSSASAFGETADGNYEFMSHALVASFGWRF